MGAALWSWFLVGSEGDVRHWGPLPAGALRPSGPCAVPWCFAVSESPARTSLWSCFEGMGAALWSWFPVGSEGNVRQWSLLARRRFCPSVPWCFAVSESPAGTSLWSCFEGMGAALWSWFLVGLKATLGSGACLLGAASVLQCHGALLFRNRPLELRCGAVLRAWERHFGAGFLSVQKLGTGACFRLSVPWCFAVSESPARTSLWSCFEGMGAALWSWFLVGSEGDVRHWGPLPAGAFRFLGPWCFAVSQPPARSSLRSCFQGVGAALWSWFLVGSEGDVRHWGPLPAGAFRPSGPWCLLFRNRLLGLRCGAALRAWEMRFGAGFCGVFEPFF